MIMTSRPLFDHHLQNIFLNKSLYSRKWRGTKEPLDEGEKGEWKTWLKLNIQKTKIMAAGPITSQQIDGETMETVVIHFIFLWHTVHS